MGGMSCLDHLCRVVEHQLVERRRADRSWDVDERCEGGVVVVRGENLSTCGSIRKKEKACQCNAAYAGDETD